MHVVSVQHRTAEGVAMLVHLIRNKDAGCRVVCAVLLRPLGRQMVLPGRLKPGVDRRGALTVGGGTRSDGEPPG